MWIHQNAWFHLGKFDNGIVTDYTLNDKNNGVYFFVLNGSVKIDEQLLNKRDGYGVWDITSLKITSNEPNTEVLVMEVPMQLN